MKSTKVQNPQRNKYSAVVEKICPVAEYCVPYRIGPRTIIMLTLIYSNITYTKYRACLYSGSEMSYFLVWSLSSSTLCIMRYIVSSWSCLVLFMQSIPFLIYEIFNLLVILLYRVIRNNYCTHHCAFKPR